jgi:hypothetical protein
VLMPRDIGPSAYGCGGRSERVSFGSAMA